jgi:hypothetical protein
MTAAPCLDIGAASVKVRIRRHVGDALRRGGRDVPDGTGRAALRAEDGTRRDDLTADAPGGLGEPGVRNGLVRALIGRDRAPLDGKFAIGHRASAVDPDAIRCPMRRDGLNTGATEGLLCRRGGLLGVSDESGDTREPDPARWPRRPGAPGSPGEALPTGEGPMIANGVTPWLEEGGDA